MPKGSIFTYKENERAYSFSFFEEKTQRPEESYKRNQSCQEAEVSQEKKGAVAEEDKAHDVQGDAGDDEADADFASFDGSEFIDADAGLANWGEQPQGFADFAEFPTGADFMPPAAPEEPAAAGPVAAEPQN